MDIFIRLPDCIKNNIIVYYLGFGTPASNLLKHEIETIKGIKRRSTLGCVDDLTLWRYKISKLQEDAMVVKSTTFSGYLAYCELTIAYNDSDMYNVPDLLKRERIFKCEMAIEAYGIVPSMI